MAIRIARRLRPLIALSAVAAAAALTPALATASPAHPKPSVASVQKQLGELALKNSQLVEKYDRAQVAVQRREKAALAARASAAKANAAYGRAHAQFTQVIQAQYESDSLGAAGALLDSNSDDNYLDRISTLDMISTHTAQVVSAVAASRDAAVHAAHTATSMLAAAQRQRNELAAQRKSVQGQIRRYQTLLSTLTSAQQYAYQRATYHPLTAAGVSTLHLPHATSAQARKAVQFALDQVGKPYSWGAGGPSSYDCSGLTMAAYASAGVSLPHSAAEQYNYGHHVSRDALQPGDLIFFYQPIGHVTIYIGDGLMVSAPTEGEDVSVVPLNAFNSDYTGATRLT